MNFELLSNEIFVEIFDYLDSIDIIHEFYNLNYRFNELILTYFRVSPRLDLQSITKPDFIITCQYLIPSLTDKIQSLHLSNDNYTPQQIDLFFSYGLSLHQFTSLKSLSLYNINSEQLMNRMMIEWQFLIHLTHLNIINCEILESWNMYNSLINSIWSLPKLTHCQLDVDIDGNNYSFETTVISLTIKYLTIKTLLFYFEEVIHLFECTPYLQYLDITIVERHSKHPYLTSSIPLLTTLKIDYEGKTSALNNLLQNVPNLYDLSIKTKDIVIKGEEWEEIISNYLSKLKIFHLFMGLTKKVSFVWNQLVNTYRSNFWLNERKWYIQDHHYGHNDYVERDKRLVGLVYTLPYTFNDYIIPQNSTYYGMAAYYSNFLNTISHNHVHYLSCDSTPKFGFRNQFSQLYHLSIKLPINDEFWNAVPTFDQLQKLDISLSYIEAYNEKALYQLQLLLEQAPNLTSLSIESTISQILPLLECTSKSIIKLNLETDNEYFKHSDCATLFLSSLGKQCKILSIAIANRIDILKLVQEMPELQTLHVDDPVVIDDRDSLTPDNDHLIQWLQSKLPFTSTITRDPIFKELIHIWIR